jgi:hypothetical protein
MINVYPFPSSAPTILGKRDLLKFWLRGASESLCTLEYLHPPANPAKPSQHQRSRVPSPRLGYFQTRVRHRWHLHAFPLVPSDIITGPPAIDSETGVTKMWLTKWTGPSHRRPPHDFPAPRGKSRTLGTAVKRSDTETRRAPRAPQGESASWSGRGN